MNNIEQNINTKMDKTLAIIIKVVGKAQADCYTDNIDYNSVLNEFIINGLSIFNSSSSIDHNVSTIHNYDQFPIDLDFFFRYIENGRHLPDYSYLSNKIHDSLMFQLKHIF